MPRAPSLLRTVLAQDQRSCCDLYICRPSCRLQHFSLDKDLDKNVAKEAIRCIMAMVDVRRNSPFFVMYRDASIKTVRMIERGVLRAASRTRLLSRRAWLVGMLAGMRGCYQTDLCIRFIRTYLAGAEYRPPDSFKL